MKPAALALAVCALPFSMAGCSSASDLVGLATGAAAGGATANPAVGYLVAVGTAVAADETFKWISRTRHRGEQDAIAAAASTLPEGGVGEWAIRHDIPIGNAHGEVFVARAIDTKLAQCREIVFSVIDDPPDPPANYATTICQQGDQWKWATAEWAVDRWNVLR